VDDGGGSGALGTARPQGLRLQVRTIGDAWIAIAARILSEGVAATYDGLAIRELLMVTLVVAEPASADPLIERLGDQRHLAWMHANFTDTAQVPELGDADSYATRLRDYARSGRDQVAWVIDRLHSDPSSRSATITTLQPLTDTSYIPCVSLLDFYVEDGEVHLSTYAHSIDFGTKGHANLVELARLQEDVASGVHAGVGTLTMVVKSAHVYASDADGLSETVRMEAGEW
jgi:thymidylate synthase